MNVQFEADARTKAPYVLPVYTGRIYGQCLSALRPWPQCRDAEANGNEDESKLAAWRP